MHATGPIAIASIQVASTANSIHRGYSRVKRASPTHGGRWLAQTNYDAFMAHYTTDIWYHVGDEASYCMLRFNDNRLIYDGDLS